MLLDHLGRAELVVAKGAGLVERERALIEERRRAGLDMSKAERLLNTLVDVQQLHVAHLEQIRKVLAELD